MEKVAFSRSGRKCGERVGLAYEYRRQIFGKQAGKWLWEEFVATVQRHARKERGMQWYIKERLKAQDEAVLGRKYTQEEDKELHENVIANWGKNPVTKRS